MRIKLQRILLVSLAGVMLLAWTFKAEIQSACADDVGNEANKALRRIAASINSTFADNNETITTLREFAKSSETDPQKRNKQIIKGFEGIEEWLNMIQTLEAMQKAFSELPEDEMKRQKASINWEEPRNLLAKSEAMQRAYLEFVEGLKTEDLKLTTKNGDSIWWSALKIQNRDAIRVLLSKGASVEELGKAGATPLHYEAQQDNADLVRILIDQGANVNAINSEGWTPLMIVSELGNLDSTTDLIDNGAKINAINKEGSTPLIIAASNNKDQQVKLLLANGADVNARNSEGWSALMFAAQEGNSYMARLLLEKGAKVDTSTNDGWTPVQMATARNQTKVLKELVARGGQLTDRPGDDVINPGLRCTYNLLIGSPEGYADHCREAVAIYIKQSEQETAPVDKGHWLTNASWYALQAGDVDGAGRYAELALNQNANDTDASCNRGHAYMLSGDRQEAMAGYCDFISHRPDADSAKDDLANDIVLMQLVYPDRAERFAGVFKELCK